MTKTIMNKKKFACLHILLVTILFASGQAFAWTKNATFDSGTDGATAQGTSGFDNASATTTYSSTQSVAGSKAAKMYHAAGSVGVLGYVAFPSDVGNGGEVWSRGYFYFASPWNWTCSPVIKVLRGAHIANSGGGNVGYLSVFADSSGNILLSNEPAGVQKSTGVKFDLDKWQSIEMYVKLSTGSSIFRIWKNGILIYEDTNRTLNASSDYADYSYIMSNWNGGSPQNQTEYVDEFLWTNSTPSQKDSSGHPMIGPNNANTVSLVPPGGLRVTAF